MAEKQSAVAATGTARAKRAGAALASALPGLRVLLPLALATLLMLLAFFLIWQCALVYAASDDVEASESARARQITAIGAVIRGAVEKADEVVRQPGVIDALAGGDDAALAAAAQAARDAWPDLVDAAFYTPKLIEVLRDDLGKLGYARAQMLMQAQSTGRPAPAQMRIDADHRRLLVLAMPVPAGSETIAYAYLQLPFEPVVAAFRGIPTGGGRVELRQGDGRGDLLIDGTGANKGSSVGDLGLPVPNSKFRIALATPDDPIFVTRDLRVLVPMTALCLFAAFVALWLRQVGMQRALDVLRPGHRTPVEEITLGDAMKKQQAEQAVKAVTARPAQPAPVAAKVEEAVSVDRSIFRAYDIRGVLGRTLTTGVARLIGRAIGSEAQQRGLSEIVVGRDGRLSGPELSAALIEGLRSAGCDVIDIGLAPTPLTYFAAYHLQTGSCISVTGSHNPPDYNGFKIVLGGETLSEGAIQDLYGRIAESRFSTGSGGLQVIDVTRDYTARISDDIQVEKSLKVVVDCGNGVAGAVAPAVLEGIGCEVIPLYCEVDGQFPNHHPDPSDPHNLQDLILSVKQTGADIGLAFDGDGDRLGVVTRSGEVIFPDRLLMLFAIDVLSRNPGATIIYDVKCTGHLQPLILQHGGSPVMWRTGHSLIKAKMRETDAQLAGEMSGHFFFGERWYGFDDGIYSAARLLEILAGDLDGRTPEEIFAGLPKGVSTPELKIPLHEGEHYRFIEAFRKQATFDGARLTTIDGVRADWPDGWGLVRASNTTPVLVLRFDADNDAALARIQATFREQLLALDRALPLPF